MSAITCSISLKKKLNDDFYNKKMNKPFSQANHQRKKNMEQNGIVYIRNYGTREKPKIKRVLYFLNKNGQMCDIQIQNDDLLKFESTKPHSRSNLSSPDFLMYAELWLKDTNFDESMYANQFDFKERGKFEIFTVTIGSNFDLSSSKITHLNKNKNRHSLKHNESQMPLVMKTESDVLMNQSSDISLTYQSSNTSSSSGGRISNIDQLSLLNTDDPSMIVKDHSSSCKCIIC